MGGRIEHKKDAMKYDLVDMTLTVRPLIVEGLTSSLAIEIFECR